MNNYLMNPKLSTVASSAAQQAKKLLKLLVFRIGNLNFALPIESVKKVINYTQVYSSGLGHLGVAHVGEQEITVIDLHKRLFKSTQQIQDGSQSYLIIAKNSISENFGILVEQTPSLIDVPSSQIRALPESYRRADTLEIASHVTVIPQESESLTVFLLDVDRLVAPV